MAYGAPGATLPSPTTIAAQWLPSSVLSHRDQLRTADDPVIGLLVDGTALKVAGGIASGIGLASVPGIFSLVTNRRSAKAQITAATIVATNTAQIEAGKVAAQTRTETERVTEDRAKRVADEVDKLVSGLQGMVLTQGVQIDRLWKELEVHQQAIRQQRLDMNAMAEEKAALTQTVANQEEKIADLQTDGIDKARKLLRLDAWKGAAMRYITALIQQIQDLGHIPEPPPPELSDDHADRQRKKPPS
jgi:predicted outer membrane protein